MYLFGWLSFWRVAEAWADAPLAEPTLGVRRDLRKESGAERDHLSTNRERLISSQADEPRQNPTGRVGTTTGCGVGGVRRQALVVLAGEEGFEPSIS